MLLSFTNGDGDVLDIDNNYILSKNWSGFSESPVSHQMSKAPYQVGRTYIDSDFDARDCVIEFLIKADDRQTLFDRRRVITRHFNPKFGVGTLTWTQEDGGQYCLDCIPHLPIFVSGRGQNHWYQEVILRLTAPYPYWYDPEENQEVVFGFSGGLSFPFSFPISFGQVGARATLVNDGDVDTPVMIYLYGEIADPTIRNVTTDEEIIISGTISDGDIMIINTAFGEKSVLTLSGGVYTNTFEDVDPDSAFWNLEPGDNIIQYTTTNEGDNAQCRILWYNRYSGV